MKKILLTLTIFGGLVNDIVAQQDKEFKFSIGCKVTDQLVLVSEDGVSKRYEGFKDGLDIGDSFRVNFNFRKLGNWLVLRVDAPSLGNVGGITGIYDSTTGRPLGPVGYLAFKDDYGDNVGTLYKDYLSLDSIESFTMSRYYKNDWQLMAGNGNSPEGAWLVSANCQSMPTQFDDMYESFHEVLKKKEIK